MRIWEYKDYAEYIAVQKDYHQRSVRKGGSVSSEKGLKVVATGLRSRLGIHPLTGLCHGVRNGQEQQWFREYLDISEILGTDIGETAGEYPDTITWDFHRVKTEWIGKYDFIYSNALNHSCKPTMALKQWMRCVRQGGYCVLHWRPIEAEKGKSISGAPTGFTLGEVVDLAMQFGRVTEVERYDSPTRRTPTHYFIWVRACRQELIEVIPKWEG